MNEKISVIQQHEENVWFLINTDNGEIENIVTKNGVIEYCESIYEYYGYNIEHFLDHARDKVKNDLDANGLDHYCEEYDKFAAWLDYVCAEYLLNRKLEIYKQRLLDFE